MWRTAIIEDLYLPTTVAYRLVRMSRKHMKVSAVDRHDKQKHKHLWAMLSDLKPTEVDFSKISSDLLCSDA